MSDLCPECGANLALVGRAHHCKPASYLHSDPDEGLPSGDVNEVNIPQDTVNKPLPKRGEYPNTDERRKYMREYMMKKRRGKL